MIESQWFWLTLIVLCIIMYLIASKICDTIEAISIAKYNFGFSINNIEQLDDLINNLQQIKKEIVKEENNYEK